jgi:type II secretory pathway component GspD/PulD (secretin)
MMASDAAHGMAAWVRRGLAVAMLTGLAACTETQEALRGQITAIDARVGERIASLGSRPRMRAGGAQVSDAVFMAASAERASQAGLLPPEMQVSDAVSLISREPMSLADISLRLSEITGIAHVTALGPSGLPTAGSIAAADGAALGRSTGEEAQQTPAQAAPEPAPGGRVARPAGATGAGDLTMRPRLAGSLAEVLNEVAAHFDVEWTYEDRRIVFRDFVTRQYQFSLLSTRTALSGSVGNVSLDGEVDPWQEITATMETLVGEGANISIGSGTGVISVTARIPDHERLRDYVARMNAIMGQQVSFDVNVITVTLSNNDAVGIDIAAVLSGTGIADDVASGTFGEVMAEGGGAVQGAVGVVNVAILNPDFEISALVSALSRQGRVAIETRTGATTTNNRMVPIRVTDTQGYVRSTTTQTNTDGAVTGVTYNTDTIETGFSMFLLPRVLNSREVMVEYAIELSDLNALENFGEGEAIVQLPEISRTSLSQQAILENGQTLVLAGFERQRVTSNTVQTGIIQNVFGGGGDQASLDRVAQVIMITPRIVARWGTTR